MDLEAMLAEQISKAVAGAIPSDTANKSDVQAAVDALKAEIPALVKAAVAEVMPALDRQGVGSKNVVNAQVEPTLEDDPTAYLMKKAQKIESVDEWTAEEKAVINGIFNHWMTRGMGGMSNDDN